MNLRQHLRMKSDEKLNKKKAKILRLKVTAYVFFIYILKYFISGCFSLDLLLLNKTSL